MIELSDVVYDRRAKDGTWCRLPYLNHPKGCPNFPKCPNNHNDFLDLRDNYIWYAVIEEFNLKIHAEGMKWLHPNWTERQCRNLLYWQGGVRRLLLGKAYMGLYQSPEGGILLEIPEANGVNVFETMALVGITIDRHPENVRKVMLVGKRKE